MFVRRIELFSILGFRVSLDFSWFLLALLVVWSLARGYFPSVIDGLGTDAALVLGLIGALGLFLSIILHEFSHALVARQFDIPIAGITLFIFGGVAEMEEEPPSAKSEFLMAIAGPVASYVLAALFYGLALLLPPATAEAPAGAVFSYLGLINLVLATFNLVPAFPLDGGRVFRAAIWWWTGNLAKATGAAAATGRLLGTLLMVLGVFSVVSGNFIAGMWQALIGLFIIGAARSSEMHMILNEVFRDVPVRQIMVEHPVTVPADTPVEEIIERYFYRHGHKVFPVVQGSRLLGCLRLEDIGRIPVEDRQGLTATDVLTRDGMQRTVTAESTVSDALDIMRKQNSSRLLVTRKGRLEGMVTMRDIMNHVAVRQEIASAARKERPA